jgi:hypothetical protein
MRLFLLRRRNQHQAKMPKNQSIEAAIRIEELKSRLTEISSQLRREGKGHILLNQQAVEGKHMSFSGGNGRLGIAPVVVGYDISLSGLSLEAELTEFMEEICGKPCSGHKQKNSRLGLYREPFWRVEDFDLVKRAIAKYAATSK